MRSLQRSDLPALNRILIATGAFTTDEIDCAVELLNIVLDQPKQTDYQVFVAENNGSIAGYVLYGAVPLTKGNFDIYWVATDPALHGQGFGQKLMEAAEYDARWRGGRMVCLETSSQGGYEKTRRFYDRSGYVEESRIRDFYKIGDDRITYVKRFSS